MKTRALFFAPNPVGGVSANAARENAVGPARRGRQRDVSRLSRRRVGDVLTVVIEETTGQDAQEQRSLSKATTMSNTTTGDWSATTIGQIFKGLGFQVDAGNVSNRTFNGQANSSIARTFTDRMTFVVVDVLPNGNLVVEGCRQRLIARELRTLRLTGIVRPADISFNNVVQSQSIGNLYFTYEGRGPESTATNQNWAAASGTRFGLIELAFFRVGCEFPREAAGWGKRLPTHRPSPTGASAIRLTTA